MSFPHLTLYYVVHQLILQQNTQQKALQRNTKHHPKLFEFEVKKNLFFNSLYWHFFHILIIML